MQIGNRILGISAKMLDASVDLINRVLDFWIPNILKIQDYLFSRGFDYGICGIVLISLILILLNIMGISSIGGISIVELDFLIFSLLVIEYCLRVIFSPSTPKYLRRYWYDIPGMIPLVAFELIPQAQLWGLIRFLRLIRLFVVLRSDIVRGLILQLTEEISSRAGIKMLEAIRSRIHREIDSGRIELSIRDGIRAGIEDLARILNRTPGFMILNPLLGTRLSRKFLENLQDLAGDLVLKSMDIMGFRDLIKRVVDRLIQEIQQELRRKS